MGEWEPLRVFEQEHGEGKTHREVSALREISGCGWDSGAMTSLCEPELSLCKVELKVQSSACQRLGTGIGISQEIPERTLVQPSDGFQLLSLTLAAGRAGRRRLNTPGF